MAERKRQHETSDEDENATVPSCSKSSDEPKRKRKAEQKFIHAYHQKYACLVPSRKGPFDAFCTTCKADFSCKHGGLFDCTRHCESKSHKEKAKATTCLPMTEFLKSKKPEEMGTLEQDVTKAEAMICQLIVDSNLPLASADKFSKAMTVMFPDSKIASSEYNTFSLNVGGFYGVFDVYHFIVYFYCLLFSLCV